MNNLIKTLIHDMAKRNKTILTPRHFEILEFAYRYYQKNRVGPLYPNIFKFTHATKEEIKEMFPNGLESVYSWVGIPIQSLEQGCKPMVQLEVDDYRDVFLNHNATTPIRKEVREVLCDHYADPLQFGNPSSSSKLGEISYDLVFQARMEIAECLSVSPDTIYFVGSGSEACNLAIKGIAFQQLRTPADKKGHIITSQIEHAAVLNTCAALELLGFSVSYVKPTPNGIITADAVKRHIQADTILAAINTANNEIGTINPVSEIGQVCADADIPFFTDAIQAFGKLPLAPTTMHIDMLAISGHKIYAPKGVAALYVSPEINLMPLIHGGPQESDLRAGTENVGSIIGFGLAARLAHREMEQESIRQKKLRDYLLENLYAIEPNLKVNGTMDSRLSNNLNIGFPSIDSGSLLLSLNFIGIFVSAGSACNAGAVEQSHVIRALYDDEQDYGNIRISLGRQTTKEDLDYFFKYLKPILIKLKETDPTD